MGDCTLAQAWLSPPGWPGEPLALPSHPLGLSTTTGPGHRTGGSSGTHAEPRGGRGDREEVKRRGSGLPFGLYFSIKEFQSTYFDWNSTSKHGNNSLHPKQSTEMSH